MIGMDKVLLGVNHMFLYPESMKDGAAHTVTLKKLAANPLVEALDCWVWADRAKEEIPILRDCGKHINYNIGDRFGEKPVFPASSDSMERTYALDILRRESEFALECGAKKIIVGSGPDVPDNREEALKRYVDFVLKWSEYLPEDAELALEPTDRDIDKFFLLGTLEDTCGCVRRIREEGYKKVGILLDMGHIPLMHETIESAVEQTAELLNHIHLGNCLLKDRANPLYGDKHPCWGAEGGEYDERDGARLLKQLKKAGYLSKGQPQTISFEMRTLTGMDAEETLKALIEWFQTAIVL